MARLCCLFTIVLALSACEPFLILPGGGLDGQVSPAPSDWAALETIKTVQLETKPGDPYSVNIWIIGLGPELYVHAGENRAAWVENMLTDPNVRIRVGNTLYPLRAARVTGQDEFDRFSAAYEKKYDRRPRNENVAQAYLFRLKERA